MANQCKETTPARKNIKVQETENGHKKKAEKLSKAKRGNQELVSNIDTHAFTLKENHRSLRGEMSKET